MHRLIRRLANTAIFFWVQNLVIWKKWIILKGIRVGRVRRTTQRTFNFHNSAYSLKRSDHSYFFFSPEQASNTSCWCVLSLCQPVKCVIFIWTSSQLIELICTFSFTDALVNENVNPFVSSAPFLYPLKTSEKRKVVWCFQEVEKGCIRDKWVNSFMTELPIT